MNHFFRRVVALSLAALLLLAGTVTASAETSSKESRTSSFIPVTAPTPAVDLVEETFTIPDVVGVQYMDEDQKYFTPGVHRASSWEQVRAVPKPGYSLTGAEEWSITLGPDPASSDVTLVTAEAPTFDVDGRTFTIPESTGFDYYRWGGQLVAPGEHALLDGEERVGLGVNDHLDYRYVGVSGVQATYTPLLGYRLLEPTFDVANWTFTIPSDSRVQYYMNGHRIKPGSYTAVGATVSVTFRVLDPQARYTWSAPSWKVRYPSPPPFTDLTEGMEHYDHMAWMKTAGISNGWVTTTTHEYRPLSPVNRDAMAAFLYRLDGSPKVVLPSKSPFADVRASDEHYTAVIWAYQHGITTGWRMPDGTRQFRPTQAINRDAMAAFLFRYADLNAYTGPQAGCFTDVATGQQFANEMCWMKTTGISQGWSDGTYRPLQPVKRDAMAAFLHRYTTKV